MTTGQQTDPLIGRLVDGRYQVRARIARGGMATVYVATDLRLERRVALKVMHAHLTDDSLFESRFIQEARQAARLADPHVVNVFDQGRDGDMAYLVMEYLPGITLRDQLREQRRLSVAQTITIMDAILSGLSAAHRAGIVHRDVKPENVLLSEDGRIKIGDFGLARATTANTASGALLMGTIAYLAPELVTRGSADARSDIYSLGIVLYEMLVGEQPYKGEQPMQIAFQHATDSVPRPSVRNPGVPEPLDELVLWATERDPADRPTDAGTMLVRLREIEDQLGVRPQVARPPSARLTPLGGDDVADTGAATKVMPGAFTAPTVTHDVDSATRLRRRTRRNASKGAWLLVLVLLLAAVAGGTGWYFGSGPGSLVAVPDVSGAAGYDEAASLLAAQTFVPSRQDVFSIDVPSGGVVGTDPVTGTLLAKDAAVAVLVSQGPESHAIPALAGLSAAAARQLLVDARIQVGDDQPFYADAADGLVFGAQVVARAGGDGVDCSKGCTVFEGDSAALQVSKGPVPDVSGRSVGSATEALTAAGLVVATDQGQDYSDSIDEGRVIGLVSVEGLRRPGEQVTLIVSRGPAPIEVPDVTGDTVANAMARLRAAGFEPGTALPEIVWGVFKVSSTDPAGGTMQVPGTRITVRSTG